MVWLVAPNLLIINKIAFLYSWKFENKGFLII